MDRDEVVRARRRQEALDSPDLERSREEALRLRLDDSLRDLEAELAECRRRGRAFERYAEALA